MMPILISSQLLKTVPRIKDRILPLKKLGKKLSWLKVSRKLRSLRRKEPISSELLIVFSNAIDWRKMIVKLRWRIPFLMRWMRTVSSKTMTMQWSNTNWKSKDRLKPLRRLAQGLQESNSSRLWSLKQMSNKVSSIILPIWWSKLLLFSYSRSLRV